MNNSNYSVLMSVYHKDNPDYIKESIDSILNQTIKTDDFVIVIDGPVSEAITSVLNNYKTSFPEVINIVPLSKNSGLGNALNEGLKHCKNDIVVRQDSDDISLTNRVELELNLLSSAKAQIVSGTVLEFTENTDVVNGKRELPITNDEIIAFSRKRTPFNHPAVMFSKEAVLKAGGYNEEYHLFEDYYLWIRMLKSGAVGANIKEGIVYMRVDKNTMVRRGGRKYASDMLKFHKWLKDTNWSTSKDYITGAIPHAIVCVLPAFLRKLVYKVLH